MTNRSTSASRSVSRVIAALFCVFCLIVAGAAQALEKPKGRAILTIDGNISVSNTDQGLASFDRDMLETLEMTTIITETPWTEGKTTFEGVLLRKLLEAIGAKGTTLRTVAINDYAVEIPMADTDAYPVILALKMNGAYMTVRKKGPLWVIYPWTDYPEIQNEIYHARSIWQLKSITVK